ncbi:MAG: IS110 family transposase [Gemmatimonadetes bacterium]|nr:IS110 family transposase [Gemmatimonadota bacterium]
MMRPEAWFADVDWASQTHHVCVVGGDGSKQEERAFRHGGTGLAEMADWIAARCGGSAPEDIPVAIEIPHGPVVECLLDHGFAVYSINPKQLDRFRDRFSPAGAKDDSLDARVLADALRTDLHHFRRIDPVDPVVIELRAWSRIFEELTRDRTRLSNRVRDQLWRYYPQILEAVGSVVEPWFLDLWAKAPTPAKARRIQRRTLESLLKRHRIRRITADQLQEVLRAPAVAVAPGTTEAAVAHIKSVSASCTANSPTPSGRSPA